MENSLIQYRKLKDVMMQAILKKKIEFIAGLALARCTTNMRFEPTNRNIGKIVMGDMRQVPEMNVVVT